MSTAVLSEGLGTSAKMKIFTGGRGSAQPGGVC